MAKKEKDELAKLDAQLAHWESTKEAHDKRLAARKAELSKDPYPWFDLNKYQSMVRKFK